MAKKTAKAATAVAEETFAPDTNNNGVVEEVRTADKVGNAFLPGHEQTVKVIKELRDAIKHEKQVLVPAFMDAQNALSVAKKANAQLVEKYKSEFARDGDTLVYDDGEVTIKVKESDTITYEVKKEE